MSRNLTPALSRKREREKEDGVSSALAPALSRKRERETGDVGVRGR